MSNHLGKLKETAEKLGISFSPNIGAKKLEEKIAANEAVADGVEVEMAEVTAKPTVKAKAKPKKITDLQVKIMLAKNLKKVKIVNLDSQNTAATTVTSGVHNQFFDVAKVIPLNMPCAVAQCLVEEIINRKHVTSTPELDKNGEPTGNFVAIEAPTYAVTFL